MTTPTAESTAPDTRLAPVWLATGVIPDDLTAAAARLRVETTWLAELIREHRDRIEAMGHQVEDATALAREVLAGWPDAVKDEVYLWLGIEDAGDLMAGFILLLMVTGREIIDEAAGMRGLQYLTRTVGQVLDT